MFLQCFNFIDERSLRGVRMSLRKFESTSCSRKKTESCHTHIVYIPVIGIVGGLVMSSIFLKADPR